MRAHVSAKTGGEPSDAAARPEQDQQADRPAQRGYQDEVPRFMAMWADHEARWSIDQRTSADPSTDTPATHHWDGGSRQHSERQADAAEAIGRIREAEPGLSADAQAIEQESKHGGWLEGFKHRLKGEDRLKEKVAEGLTTSSPDATPTQVLQLIPDAIRFTYTG